MVYLEDWVWVCEVCVNFPPTVCVFLLFSHALRCPTKDLNILWPSNSLGKLFLPYRSSITNVIPVEKKNIACWKFFGCGFRCGFWNVSHDRIGTLYIVLTFCSHKLRSFHPTTIIFTTVFLLAIRNTLSSVILVD